MQQVFAADGRKLVAEAVAVPLQQGLKCPQTL